MRRFLRIGLGSANDLKYHLLLAKDLRFLSPQDYKRIIGKLIEVKRMLTVLNQELKAEDRQLSAISPLWHPATVDVLVSVVFLANRVPPLHAHAQMFLKLGLLLFLANGMHLAG